MGELGCPVGLGLFVMYISEGKLRPQGISPFFLIFCLLFTWNLCAMEMMNRSACYKEKRNVDDLRCHVRLGWASWPCAFLGKIRASGPSFFFPALVYVRIMCDGWRRRIYCVSATSRGGCVWFETPCLAG